MCKVICTRQFHWNFQQSMDQPPNLDCNQASHIICGSQVLLSKYEGEDDHCPACRSCRSCVHSLHSPYPSELMELIVTRIGGEVFTIEAIEGVGLHLHILPKFDIIVLYRWRFTHIPVESSLCCRVSWSICCASLL